jgi:hypothetical protein
MISSSFTDTGPPSRKRKARPEAENLEPGEVKRLGRTLESSVGADSPKIKPLFRASLAKSLADEIDKRLDSITRSLGFRAQHDTFAGLYRVLTIIRHRNLRRRRALGGRKPKQRTTTQQGAP